MQRSLLEGPFRNIQSYQIEQGRQVVGVTFQQLFETGVCNVCLAFEQVGDAQQVESGRMVPLLRQQFTEQRSGSFHLAILQP